MQFIQKYRDRDMDVDIPIINSIVIKNDSFVGAHFIILKGLAIIEHTIIGAGSVFTKNVGDNKVWGGNPNKTHNTTYKRKGELSI